MRSPISPMPSRARLPRARVSSYLSDVRRPCRWWARPPTVGAYERPLSLTTITRGTLGPAAMELRASQAMPPVSAPSPTTATVQESSPLCCFASAIPSAQDRAVEAWEFSMTS